MTLTNKPMNTLSNKNRLAYIVAVLITILLGLASRKFSQLLLSFIAQNGGDTLWAMMVYFGWRFFLVRRKLLTAGILIAASLDGPGGRFWWPTHLIKKP
ncbi:hypothetical protein [Neobacillus jeddahensis]|uniref:hypothetical protein n=1 Tax=Neobacillus jeddahensis TaxID=1461580 RepID=UPI0006948517|nr:hypothetical protein [Neobacillus jeddahensis]